MSGQGDINQSIKRAKYVANSASGDAIITITNYFYREDVRVASVESAEASPDENFSCPYRGLFHFGPNDAEFFFGREVFVEKLVQETQKRNFIPVLGASGSGKSSVVLAGLVPKLEKKGHWKFTHFRPGSDPFHALALALVPFYTKDLNATQRIAEARQLTDFFCKGSVPLSDVFAEIKKNYPDDRLLLIADQFEELYTLCGDKEIRRRFLDCLLPSIQSPTSGVQSSTVLVATMRADFLGNALSYRPFADVLHDDTKIGAMNREELSQVIEKPAQKQGVTFEPELVKRILDDVEDAPGSLPLLEFTLTLLWERRTGKRLTHTAYGAIGEVQGALASYANEKYGNLNPIEQEQVRRIFIQLVRPGERAEDTRRLATKAELGEERWSLVKQLADARLVVTSRNADGQETVEVVHEALIRNWGQLRQWIETDRIFLAWQDRLRGAMLQWEEKKRDEGALLRGALLAEAEEKLQERREELSPSERDFIQQSIAARERLLRQERNRKIWRIIIGGVVSASILSAVGFAIRVGFQGQTNKSLELANASETNLNIDTTRSLWLAIAAKLTRDTPQADLALWNALQANHERFQLKGHQEGERVIYAEFDPRDSKRVLTVSSDRTARIWNLDDLGNPLVLKGHEGTVQHGCFDPQNPNRVLTVSFDGTARIWNLDNPSNPIILKGHQGPINYGSFDPKNSNRVLTVSTDGTARVWNLDNPKNPLILKGHEGDVWVGSFDPQNSNRVLTVSSDATARVWDLSKPNSPLILRGHKSQVVYGTFDPKNSNRVLTVSSDRTARIWNLNTPTQPIVLQGHLGTVRYGSFDPQDPNRVLTVSEDDNARLWNLKSPSQSQILQGHQGPITYGAFNPEDANQILTVSSDGTARVWALQTSTTLFTLRGHTKGVSFGAFDPKNSSRILTVSDDSTARIWDVSNDTFIQIPGRQKPANRSIISSTFDYTHQSQVLTIDVNGSLKTWSLKDVNDIKTLPIKLGSIQKAWFAPSNSNQIAAISSNGKFYIWNIKEPDKPLELPKGEGEIEELRFDPKNANRVMRINKNQTATVWDISNKISIELPSISQISDGEFDPNDPSHVAIASVNGTVRIWNLKELTKPLKPLLEFSASQKEIWHVSFDPKNSSRLLTMGGDRVARVWELSNFSNPSIKIELAGHQNAVVDGSFDPNNPNRVLTVSRDGTSRVWDLRIPNNPLILKGHNEGVISGSFDPQSSNRVITVGSDGTALIHIIGSKELLRLAWNNSSRCLTSVERANYNLMKLEPRQLLFNYFSKPTQLLSKQKYRPYCQQQLPSKDEKKINYSAASLW